MKFFNNLILLILNGGVMLCCVIPAILVSLGLGSTLATFLNHYPIFIKISEYKNYIFIFVFLILIINGFILYTNKNRSCDINSLEQECTEVKSVSLILYYLSIVIYLISLFLSYIF